MKLSKKFKQKNDPLIDNLRNSTKVFQISRSILKNGVLVKQRFRTSFTY